MWMVEWGRSESLGRLAVYIGAAPVASPTCNAGYEHTQTVETLVPAERPGHSEVILSSGCAPSILGCRFCEAGQKSGSGKFNVTQPDSLNEKSACRMVTRCRHFTLHGGLASVNRSGRGSRP